ncbi:MAG: hypothetical protein HXX13_10645 [Bacteroidetes bacterium]|nr:hypothetical protein [Bacteroidota bacterium]
MDTDLTSDNKAGEYSIDIPIIFDGDYWQTTAESNGWSFLPRPHVDGTHTGSAFVFVDFVFPSVGSESDDWLYFGSVFLYPDVTSTYRRSTI